MRRRLSRLLVAGAVAAALACAGPASAATACSDAPGAVLGHAGPASVSGGARVAIVPDGSIARAYVDELRVMLAARSSGPAALSLIVNRGADATLAQSAMQIMRTPAIAADGRFRCGGLEPGAYLAIVFVSSAARDAAAPLDPATLHVFVASATVGARTDAAITGWTDLGGSR